MVATDERLKPFAMVATDTVQRLLQEHDTWSPATWQRLDVRSSGTYY